MGEPTNPAPPHFPPPLPNEEGGKVRSIREHTREQEREREKESCWCYLFIV